MARHLHRWHRAVGPGAAPVEAPGEDPAEAVASDAVVVEAVGLTKDYGPRRVLHDVSLALRPGETLLLRGRSGSGKTTLLHLLAGFDQPTAGTVRLAAQDLATLDGAARAALRLATVGLVFQHFNLVPDLTAEENVRLPLALARRRGARERALALLERVGAGSLAKAFPSSLSGGEMQRVAIARALANHPRLVLADEPTANLDDRSARVVLEVLAGLAAEGRAVLVASHDPLAGAYFPRQATLREGALGELGLEAPQQRPLQARSQARHPDRGG